MLCVQSRDPESTKTNASGATLDAKRYRAGIVFWRRKAAPCLKPARLAESPLRLETSVRSFALRHVEVLLERRNASRSEVFQRLVIALGCFLTELFDCFTVILDSGSPKLAVELRARPA